MKVALYHHLPPGGALRVVTEFLRRLPEGVSCNVYGIDSTSIWPYAAPGQEVVDGQRVTRVPLDLGLAGRVAGGKAARLGIVGAVRKAETAVAAEIDRAGYDLAFVHPCWVTQTPMLLRDLATPTAYFMQEPRRASFEKNYAPRPMPADPRRVPRWAMGKAVEHRLRRNDVDAVTHADVVLANSYYSSESIQRAYGITPTVAYLGVDEARFVLRADDRDNAVLSVGGFERFKGHHRVAEALASLPSSRRPHLRIVYERNDPTYRDEVRSFCRDHEVVLEEHQGISDAELAVLYGSSAATILAADLEPFGLTMLESMATGTPVVAYREGGYREVVKPGITGVLVDRATGSLADAIADVLASGYEPGAVRDAILPFWSWDSAVARQLDVLSHVRAAADR